MNNSNFHRLGKHRFECNLTKPENSEVEKAMQLTGCKSKRELLMILVERFNRKMEQ